MCASVRGTKEVVTGPIALTITMGRSSRLLVLRRESERKEVGLARPDPLLRRTKHGLRPRTKPRRFSPRDKRKVERKEDPENGPPPPSPIAKAVVRFGLVTRERVFWQGQGAFTLAFQWKPTSWKIWPTESGQVPVPVVSEREL